MRKTPYEKKKKTYHKCVKRFKLFESIMVGGSKWNIEDAHHYAKVGYDGIIRGHETNVREIKAKAKAQYDMNSFNVYCIDD